MNCSSYSGQKPFPQSFNWVFPCSQVNNLLPLLQFIGKSCLFYIHDTPKFQPFLTSSLLSPWVKLLLARITLAVSSTLASSVYCQHRSQNDLLKTQIISRYSSAQNLPVTTHLTENKTANLDVGLESAMPGPHYSFLVRCSILWLLHSVYSGLLTVP